MGIRVPPPLFCNDRAGPSVKVRGTAVLLSPFSFLERNLDLEAGISTETTLRGDFWWKKSPFERLFQVGYLFDTLKNRVVTSGVILGSF
jgi:hypothetical protein